MSEHTIDTLAEFHAEHPDDAVYALMAHLVTALQTRENNLELTLRHVSNILGEVESTRILHVICQISHVDYLALMQDCQGIMLTRVSPRLLLHIALLPVPYVASKLQIDQYWATQLLDQLHRNFTIDDPVLWLKRFLDITTNERLRYNKEKHDLLMGLAVTGKPIDTAEFRRANWYHRMRPIPGPPGRM